MATLTIRNIDEAIKTGLRLRAAPPAVWICRLVVGSGVSKDSRSKSDITSNC